MYFIGQNNEDCNNWQAYHDLESVQKALENEGPEWRIEGGLVEIWKAEKQLTIRRVSEPRWIVEE